MSLFELHILILKLNEKYIKAKPWTKRHKAIKALIDYLFLEMDKEEDRLLKEGGLV